jgi:Zn-dependent peptidase ImmA (M78 family)
MTRFKEAKQTAKGVLNDLRTGKQPIDLEELCKRLEIQLDYTDLPEELSGLYTKTKKAEALIGINKNLPLRRQRFALAHALGHYFLHGFHHLLYETHQPELVYTRVDSAPQFRRFLESEANIFAAELLMPEDNLKKDIATTRDPLKLAEKYQVSEAAMQFRLKSLRLV